MAFYRCSVTLRFEPIIKTNFDCSKVINNKLFRRVTEQGHSSQIQPGRMILQYSPPPFAQQKEHCSCQFDGLIPAIPSEIFPVVIFLVTDFDSLGNSMVYDFSFVFC